MKIINIIPHPPAYDLYHSDPRPEINWNTPEGQWVGIWGYDIANMVGNEILKLTNDFKYEIWQPDLRADKIYSHKFKNGLVHRLFPANKKRVVFGLKIKDRVSSPVLLKNLKNIYSEYLILHISSLSYYINQEIIRMFYFIPKIIDFRSEISSLPYNEMIKLRKNILANISYLKMHKALLKNKKIFFTHNNSKNNNALMKYNPLGIERILTGCDFNYWRAGNKKETKKSLGVNPNTKVFLLASRFYRLKQIDKAIKIFTSINKSNDYDFKLFIAGHGKNEYEVYLKKISSNLLKKGKLFFTGYLNEEKMRKLYQASDLFVSASISEGGPTSVVKAIACETPVMCTRVGGVDDFLVQQNAGILVDSSNYKEWHRMILKILDGQIIVKLVDREKAKEIFHWPNVAKKWIDIYRELNDISR